MKCVPVVLALTVVACAEDPPQPIVVRPSPVYVEAHGDRGEATVVRVEETAPDPPGDVSRIQVLPTKRPDRATEVVGVVDAHVPMGQHERALDVLRRKAAALGADAVIGVEFEHGEGHEGEPLHLSGLAVRYIDRPLRTE